jgi:antirestriction protein ArdC
MAFDIYAAVTDRIIRQLEAGCIPWQKPWGGMDGGAVSGTTGKPYSLLNQMILGKPGMYFTFNQVQKMGGHIRKGEKSQIVVFWKQVPTKEQDAQTGEQHEKLVPMLRYYNVFHLDQIDGIDAVPVAEPKEIVPHAQAEEIISAYIQCSGVELTHRIGDEAYYSPAADRVVLPAIEQFNSLAEYYSTAFHELTHSTGHKSRLDRLRATAHFGNESYSNEELVAEIGAAALMNYAEIEIASTLRNSAAYIQSWLRALKNDKRMIVTASGAASRAFAYITGTEEIR